MCITISIIYYHYIHICMCACVYIYIYIHVYTHMYVTWEFQPNTTNYTFNEQHWISKTHFDVHPSVAIYRFNNSIYLCMKL